MAAFGWRPRTEGDLQQRARSLGAKTWWAVLLFTALITLVSFRLQPSPVGAIHRASLGLCFSAARSVGLAGMRMALTTSRHGSFLSSCLFLVGMLTSAAFGVFPYVLPSNVSADAGLTVFNAAAPAYGLHIGLAWWIPGMLLTACYSVFVYRRLPPKAAD